MLQNLLIRFASLVAVAGSASACALSPIANFDAGRDTNNTQDASFDSGLVQCQGVGTGQLSVMLQLPPNVRPEAADFWIVASCRDRAGVDRIVRIQRPEPGMSSVVLMQLPPGLYTVRTSSLVAPSVSSAATTVTPASNTILPLAIPENYRVMGEVTYRGAVTFPDVPTVDVGTPFDVSDVPLVDAAIDAGTVFDATTTDVQVDAGMDADVASEVVTLTSSLREPDAAAPWGELVLEFRPEDGGFSGQARIRPEPCATGQCPAQIVRAPEVRVSAGNEPAAFGILRIAPWTEDEAVTLGNADVTSARLQFPFTLSDSTLSVRVTLFRSSVLADAGN